MPTSMEQLLERQWDQGSAFLMEQGQHFDSKPIKMAPFDIMWQDPPTVIYKV